MSGVRGDKNRRGREPEIISGTAEVIAPPASLPVIQDAVTSLVSGLPDSSASSEQVREYLRKSVSTELARRNIPDNELRWPRMDVVMPAVEAMRYSQLGATFSRLIASSMDGRTAYSVLPAYVEFLKQLGEDELTLLRNAPDIGRFTPIADVVYILPTEQVMSAYRNVLPEGSAKGCVFPKNVPLYIDNLIRLNLLVRPVGQLADDVSYRRLARQDFVRTIMKAAPPTTKAGLDKSVIGLTDLGDGFRKACVL